MGLHKQVRAKDSLGSYVSARTPPWLRELLSMRIAAAIAARAPPAPPRTVGRVGLGRRGLFHISSKKNPVVWVQLLPFQLPSHQVHVCLCLHYQGRAAAEAEEAAEWDKQLRGRLRLEVGNT